jgi:hypothetical protein
VATYIGRAKTAVERSLVWQGDALFVTENFILPPLDGARVFNQEQTAVRWINDACAHPSTTPAMRLALNGVKTNLVEADRLIADYAIACAELDFNLSKKGSNHLAKARANYTKAATNAPFEAIAAYHEAWRLAYEAMNASTEKAGLKWARKLYDPDAPRLEAIGRNGDVENVSTNSDGRTTDGIVDTEQWSGDNMAGTRSWAGNTLVGPPGQLFTVGLDYLDIREGGPLTNDMLGVWNYFPRQMQDAQFRFGFLEPDAAEVPVVHGVDFGLDGILPYDSIMVCLPFRLWLGSDDPVWQTEFHGGNPVGAGVWQVKAGETIRDAQKSLTNRIGAMDFLTDVTPMHMPGFKLQVGAGGMWQVLTDINRDGDVDIDTTSAMSGNRPSDYTNVSTHSGLWITTGAAGGMRDGRVGISPMTVSYDESALETVPAVPRNKRPLEVRIPGQSYVSPVPVEGKRWSAAYRVYASASTLGGSNEVAYLDARAFVTDLPLDPAGPATVAFAQSGTPETVVTGSIAWTALDLAGLSSSEKYIVLRDGESLLLTVSGTGSVVTIDWDGDGVVDFTGRPGDKWVAKYAGGGIYEAIARIDGLEVGSLAVQVNRVTFPVRVIAQVGRSRTALVDLGVEHSLQDVRFSAADTTVLQVGAAVANGHRVAVTVTPLKRGTPVLQARLADGTLLASFELTEFTVENRNADSVIIDGDTSIGGSELVIKPAIEKVGVRLKMFASQSTFAGGVTEFFVRSGDMKWEPDPTSGETNMVAFYEIEMPLWESSSCYNTEVYDELERPEYGSVATKTPRFTSGTASTPTPPATTLEPDSTEKSVDCGTSANPQPGIYKVRRIYMCQDKSRVQTNIFVKAQHSCSGHSLSIVPSPGTTAPSPVYDPNPAAKVTCQTANGTEFLRTVKSQATSLGFYDVKIDATTFEKRVIVLKVEMTKPKWTPGFPGDYSDVSYTFDAASKGVCTIDAAGTCGVPSLDPNLEWDVAAMSASTRSSIPDPAKGASVTFKYTGLPSSNSELGAKLLNLVYPGLAIIGQDVLIFFAKTASNNPGGSSPNWYYYWSQTSASYGTHTYNSHTSSHLGHCDWVTGAWRAFICKPSESHDINKYATTCRHEAQHVTDLSSWWPSGYPTFFPASNDSDGDMVPDALESSLGYNPTLTDTDGDGYRDCEDHASDNQPSWTYGSACSEDWANPGSQFTSP